LGVQTVRSGILVLTVLATVMCAVQGQAAPEVAIVAFNSKNPDEFAWVALSEIPADTVINFTDSSVYTNGNFRWGEHLQSGIGDGPLAWSHTYDLAIGTVVRFDGVSGTWSIGTVSKSPPQLSESGDQLFAYTGSITDDGSGDWSGDPTSATVLFGLNFGNEGWTNDGLNSSISDIPSGISSAASTAVHVDSQKNGYYSGITTGGVDQILQAIADPNNWTTGGTRTDSSDWPQSFQVLPETLLFEFSETGPPRPRALWTRVRRHQTAPGLPQPAREG